MRRMVWTFNNSFPALFSWLIVGFCERFSLPLTNALAPWHYALAAYFTFECVLDGIVEPWFEANLKTRENRLSLSTQGDGDLPSRFAHFIDCHIMNRYSFFGYKNNVKSELRVFSSLMLTVFSALFLMTVWRLVKFLNIWPDSLVATPSLGLFFGIFIFFSCIFAVEKWSYFEKWKVVSAKFQAMLEREPGLRRDVLEAAFACDLLSSGMWSHDLYLELFEKNLIKALSMHWGEYPFKTGDLKFTRQELMSRPIPKRLAERAMHDRLDRIIAAEQIDQIQRATAV